MDVDDYRKSYLAELDAEKQAAASKAADAAPGLETETNIERLLTIAADVSEAVAVRVQAIDRLNEIAFDLQAFAPYNARFIALLKQLCTDKSATIRLAAFRRLSLSLDRETRDLLQQSVLDQSKKLIPDKAAATLLSFDAHVSSRDTLRSLTEHADAAVRRVAIRGLAGDSGSADLLEAIAVDTNEDSKVRQSAALSLKVASPKRFAALAKQVVVDDSEDDGLRSLAMSALAHGAEVRNIASSADFSRELDAVSEKAKSRSLKKSIKLFKALSR